MTPKTIAESIISSLDINSPEEIEVELIANYYGISVNKRFLEGSAARLLCIGKKASITISSSEQYEPRKRFSIGHELGHFFLHKNNKGFFSCSDNDMATWIENNIEVEANVFAANLLMPEMIFRGYIIGQSPSIDLFKKLTATFGVSITSVLIRNVECSKEPYALICTKSGVVSWSKRNRDFPYFIKNKSESIDQGSNVYDCFNLGQTSKEGPVFASSWLTDYRVDPDAEIHEYSFYSPSAKTAYSLLWINEEIERRN